MSAADFKPPEKSQGQAELRIALICDELLDWQGGRDFFRILFESLKFGCTAQEQINVATRVSRDSFAWRAMRVGKHLVTRWPCDLYWIAQEFKRIPREKLISDILGERIRLAVLKGHKANIEFDVVGPFMYPPGWLGDCPWVGYPGDCQHKRLPQFFSPQECAARDEHFLHLLHAAPVVIVHSLDTKADLMRYFGPVRAEIIALPFAASVNSTWLSLDGTKLREKYRLPVEYFLCSNQFWQHKNHGVILEALAIARANGKPMSVAFTGEMHDYRNPNYTQDLLGRVEALGISNDCHFLGRIPKLDQIAIMRSAAAVIQPTLFEGTPGGLAVSDAIGVGQRVIVSDIPVNREIQQYVDEYFSPTDARALFDAACRVLACAPPRPSPERLLMEGLERRRHFGTILRAAFARAAERSNQLSQTKS
jgi:glycosyltransferase involved in cell wall biosynthesis